MFGAPAISHSTLPVRVINRAATASVDTHIDAVASHGRAAVAAAPRTCVSGTVHPMQYSSAEIVPKADVYMRASC